MPLSLDGASKIAGIISSATTTAAVIAGGYWFFRQRQAHLAVVVEQKIQHHLIDAERRYVRATFCCANKGKVAVYPIWTHGTVSQVHPIVGKIERTLGGEIEWPVLDVAELRHGDDSFVIEVSEADTWALEYVIDARAEVIQVHTLLYLARTQVAADDCPKWDAPLFPGGPYGEKAVNDYLSTYPSWEVATLVDLNEEKPDEED